MPTYPSCIPQPIFFCQHCVIVVFFLSRTEHTTLLKYDETGKLGKTREQRIFFIGIFFHLLIAPLPCNFATLFLMNAYPCDKRVIVCTCVHILTVQQMSMWHANAERRKENKQQTRRLLITEKTATHNKHLTTIQNNGGTGKVADACIAKVEKHRQQVFPDNTKHTTIDYNMNQFNFFTHYSYSVSVSVSVYNRIS